MPFQSKAQARFMFSQHPEIAKRFAAETPDFNTLPAKKPESQRQKVAVAILMQKKNANRPA